MSVKLNLVDTLTGDPKFGFLVKSLLASGLENLLKSNGPFTILAPSNLAFTKFTETRLDELLKPRNRENLAELLKYHVLNGRIRSGDLAGLKTAETLQGQSIKVVRTEFGCRINGAILQTKDIESVNGIIHSISAVLIPAIAVKSV